MEIYYKGNIFHEETVAELFENTYNSIRAKVFRYDFSFRMGCFLPDFEQGPAQKDKKEIRRLRLPVVYSSESCKPNDL
jgi:hypothetical protein